MKQNDYTTTEALLNMSDENLINASRYGNGYAVELLMERYRNFVRSKTRTYFLIGADKEDIIQEGMIGLYKAIRDFKLDSGTTFRSFAELCVTRQIITAIKKATRQKHIPLNSYISLNKPVYEDENERILLDTFSGRDILNPEEIMLDKERFFAIEDIISKILSKLELCVLTKYLEGKSYTEIAAQIGKSEKSIDNALQRIKKKIQKYIINDNEK